MAKNNKPNIAPDLVMTALAGVTVWMLVFELTHHVSYQEFILLSVIDICIALIFMGDFYYGWQQAPNKSIYFRANWFILLAAIPYETTIFQALRGLNVLRVLRVLEVVRVFHASQRLGHTAGNWLSETALRFFSLSLTAATLVFAGGAAFFHFEHGINPKVNGLFDAIWWAFGTVTTVGYGDIYPFTTAGRMVAIVLLLVGVGTIGSAIGMISSHYIRRQTQHSLPILHRD